MWAFNDSVGVVHGLAIVGVWGLHKGAEHTQWGPCVESQCDEGVVAYPHHLGSACQEVQDPVAE